MALDLRTQFLCFEAFRWVGVQELNHNEGQIIELFQKAVDGRSSNEPWCMAFVQYCIKTTELASNFLYPKGAKNPSRLFKSEHCLTVWNNSQQLRLTEPALGSVCIWQKYNGETPTTSGHTGIVVALYPDDTIDIIEGNTSPSNFEIVREGDGVFLKKYPKNQLDKGSLKLKGFLKVWD